MEQQYQLMPFLQEKKQRQEHTLDELDEECRLKVQKLLCRHPYDNQKQNEKDNEFYIDSQSKFTFVWNLLYMLLFYLATFQISVELALPSTILQSMLQSGSYYLPVYITFLVFWCVDIFLSFFKGYYVVGQVKIVSDLRMTTLRYLKTQFVIDVIVVVIYSIPLYYQSSSLNFLQIIPMLLIWVKKVKYSDENQKILQYNRFFQTIFLMTELFSDALMISNYGACLFLGMDLYLYNQSLYGQGTSSTYYWLTNNTCYSISLIDGPWWQAYIWAQSFSAGTISTLAPGPFPKNPWQAFYTIIIVIIFMILASYVGDVVGQLAATYYEARQVHQANIIAFDNFMTLKQVRKDIRIKVNSYYQLVWQLQMKVDSQEHEQLIERLPLHLRQQLMIQIGFTKHLHFLEFIKGENSIKTMIAIKIQRATIDANTCLFESSKSFANQQRKIIYIKEGMAKFYLSDQHTHHLTQPSPNSTKPKTKEKLLSLTSVGKLLGVYEFVTGINYPICCKSIDICLIQSLKWQDFWQIIQELQVQEQFNQMKHKVLVERELRYINKLCVVCLSEHVESECPQLFYNKKVQNQMDFSNLKSVKHQRAKKARKYKSNKRIFKIQKESFMQQLVKGLIVDLFIESQLFKNNTQGIEQVTNFQNYNKKFNIETY